MVNSNCTGLLVVEEGGDGVVAHVGLHALGSAMRTVSALVIRCRGHRWRPGQLR